MTIFEGIQGVSMKRNIAGITAALLGLLGCVTAHADTVIHTTQYSYNYTNQVVCTAVRMNMAITQPADPCTPAATVGPNGPDRITENVYDGAGQLTAVYRGSGTSSIIQYAYYNYTPNGLKSFEIDANHNKTTFTYDGFDRLSTIRYPNTTLGNETSSTTDYEQFAYDNNGNKTWWKRRNGIYIYYNYDNLNREVLSYPSNSSIPNLYTGYDGLGRIQWKRSGNNTPSTPGVTYAYDGLGRVAAVTDFNNRTVNYQYNAASARTKLIFPDGNYVQYTRDNLNRVYSAGLNGTTNVLFGQVFDSLGRRTSLTRGVSSVGGATTYDQDNLGRLTSFTNDLSGTAYDIAWTFSGYNAADQITTWGASGTRYDYAETATTTTAKTYDGLNRDATIVAISGGYDTNGNLAKDGARTMAYDVYNRLLTATGTGTYAGLNLRLVYDTEGRLAKYSTDGGTTFTTFLYDGTNLIGEYNNAGTLTERYIHGTGTDEPIVWYRGAGVTATAQKFLYQNYQGSVIAYTDSAGVITYYYKYDPYGVPVTAGNTARWPLSPASFGPRFSYTGQIALPEAGLYYYKARVYDPGFGRFLQTDPIGSVDDLDLYAYVRGDPINKSDPTGTQNTSSVPTLGDYWQRLMGQSGPEAKHLTFKLMEEHAKFDALGVAGEALGGLLQGVGLAARGSSIAGEAAGAGRGLSELGGIFTSKANAAGGEVWTSTGTIAQKDFTSIVNGGLYKGEVNILTGVHGAADGTTIVDQSLFKADVAKFGEMPGVTVHNLPDMTHGQVSDVLQGKGTTIGGFCNSAACLAKYGAQ